MSELWLDAKTLSKITVIYVCVLSLLLMSDSETLWIVAHKRDNIYKHPKEGKSYNLELAK